MFDYGIIGIRIGCDASHMSALVPEGFFHGALLACSLEHFEGVSDTQVFLDLEKTLSRGGKIVVTPLYIHTFALSTSDPLFSATKNVPFDHGTNVHCIEALNNRFARFYSPTTILDRILKESHEFQFSFYFLNNYNEIHRSVYCRFILLGKRL